MRQRNKAVQCLIDTRPHRSDDNILETIIFNRKFVKEVVIEVLREKGLLRMDTTVAPNVEAKILQIIKMHGGKLTPKEIAAQLGFKSKKPVIDRLKFLAKNGLIIYHWSWPAQARNQRWNPGKNQRPTLTRKGSLIVSNIDKIDGQWLEVLEKESFYGVRRKYGF